MLLVVESYDHTEDFFLDRCIKDRVINYVANLHDIQILDADRLNVSCTVIKADQTKEKLIVDGNLITIERLNFLLNFVEKARVFFGIFSELTLFSF
jgi:hypothetical protein